ncbi:hypothetical protein DEO72_LG10g2001 [Vigna unguiculata]|nr:hypothetical protein DEO72_LG10g2001 [Vigna unguiculata]
MVTVVAAENERDCEVQMRVEPLPRWFRGGALLVRCVNRAGWRCELLRAHEKTEGITVVGWMCSLLLRGGVRCCCRQSCGGCQRCRWRRLKMVALLQCERRGAVVEDARWRVAAAMADCSGELTVNGDGCRHGGERRGEN